MNEITIHGNVTADPVLRYGRNDRDGYQDPSHRTRRRRRPRLLANSWRAAFPGPPGLSVDGPSHPCAAHSATRRAQAGRCILVAIPPGRSGVGFTCAMPGSGKGRGGWSVSPLTSRSAAAYRVSATR